MGDRWLGKRHARRVSKNPLDYTITIEHTIRCIRCEQPKHFSAFKVGDVYTKVCSECRNTIKLKHR